jgi:hypothetical protein
MTTVMNTRPVCNITRQTYRVAVRNRGLNTEAGFSRALPAKEYGIDTIVWLTGWNGLVIRGSHGSTVLLVGSLYVHGSHSLWHDYFICFRFRSWR